MPLGGVSFWLVLGGLWRETWEFFEEASGLDVIGLQWQERRLKFNLLK